MKHMKTCTICRIEKSLSEFHKHKASRDGLDYRCRICHNQYKRDKYHRDPEKEINRVKIWKKNNKVKLNRYKNQWQKENRDKIRPYFRIYTKNRRDNDINFKIAGNLRTRLCLAIQNNQKSGSAIKNLGCTIEELKIYLESKFRPGMSWNNYSYEGWHIDHIKPLSKFDLENKEEFKKACHYTNLQPLWAKENIRKGNRILI